MQPKGTIMVAFADVKNVLNKLIEGRDIPRMKLTHGGKSFSWDTAEELRNAVAEIFGVAYRLIDPRLIGNGRADETLLIQVLMGPLDDDGIPRMPFRGPFATGPQIQVIREWINAGARDDATS